MQLIPVLEIRHGKCVHTEAKNSFANHVVKEDALTVINKWVDVGISRVHLVDVDAIESGEPENVDLISEIKAQHPQLLIQVLGGIKSIESAYIWIDAGADFLVLNGKAIRQRNLLDDACIEFPDKILVELDCRNGNVGMGSSEPTFELSSLAKQLEEDGVVGLVVTEVHDGNRINQGNLLNINKNSDHITMPIFANGRIEKMTDLEGLLANNDKKLSGVLIGKALHNGFCLNTANHLIQNYHSNQMN